MSQKSTPSSEIKQDLLTMFDAVSDISNYVQSLHKQYPELPEDSVVSYASGLSRQLLTLMADFHLTTAETNKTLYKEVTESGITEYNLMAINIRVDIT